MSSRKIFTFKLKEKKVIDGREYKEGQKMIHGCNCPKCGCFHEMATKVHICGCGYRDKKKRITSSQLRRAMRNYKEQQHRMKQVNV